MLMRMTKNFTPDHFYEPVGPNNSFASSLASFANNYISMFGGISNVYFPKPPSVPGWGMTP